MIRLGLDTGQKNYRNKSCPELTLPMTLFIHAVNIHSGGGAELLTAILTELKRQEREAVLLVDCRFPMDSALSGNLKVIRVHPSLLGRFRAEWSLWRMSGENDQIFSAGNLPPVFPLMAKVCLFLQNRYLLEKVSTKDFSIRVRLRIALERFWLRCGISKVERIIVQTPSMARLVLQGFGRQAEILPFTGFRPQLGKQPAPERQLSACEYDFVYIATGEPHKNHRHLFEAWEILAAESIYPSLCVTLSAEAYPDLVRGLERVRRQGGVINNVGQVPRAEVENIYSKSRALIFPSTLESFGLPLLEARAVGLAILASELDYVRDVVDPDQTFDPASGISIARAVKRFLGVKTTSGEICTADDLLRTLLGVEQGKA